ncbi:hypothetical protein [Mesomycoplasma molare]|uniref:Uncharacterized protein n=1 Tax=Mesomycoplasma molare TaxID=171288 RepID=A0ABY5TV35_9BACT|nr:hypothetical protein [Mesomycoplasma molare]UWD34502.1 hypothetical protein NX772_01570 [Mesomycoplasma molare]
MEKILSRRKKWFYLDNWILQKISSKKNSWVLLILIVEILRKIKSKKCSIFTIWKLLNDEGINLAKSSFYQAINDLKKMKFIKVENNEIFVKVKIFNSGKNQYSKIHKNEILHFFQNDKFSANQILFIRSIIFLSSKNSKNISYKKTKKINEICAWQLKTTDSNWIEQECTILTIEKEKQASFTFNFFYSFNLKKSLISRMIKNLKLKNFLLTFFNISITFFRKVTNRGIFKTYHLINKKTVQTFSL